jgi:hypothetical protein
MALQYTTTPPVDFNTTMPWAGMKRCLVLDNGTVNYYLDPNDSTKKADGTTANLTGANGQVMVEIPKFWYKKEPFTEGSKMGFRFYISSGPAEGYEVHPAFYRDRDGDGIAEEVDFRYYSAFMGYNNAGKLESLPNKSPTVSQTIGTFRSQAQARGNGWGLVDYNLLYAVQLLYLIEYGHFDSQTKIGRGYVDGNTASINTGGTLNKGNHSYGETTGKQQMSYRGIEDYWGNIFYFIDGIVTDSTGILIGNKGFNDAGTGYQKFTVTIPNTGGYISDIQSEPQLGFIGKTFSGTATSKLYDYGALYSGRVAYFGGDWSFGSLAGAFSLRLFSVASSVSSSIGARLAL